MHPKTIPTAVRVQVLKATATLKGRSRAECITHMKALSIGAVVAFRPGEIGDEIKSEGEEDEDKMRTTLMLMMALPQVSYSG